MNSLIKNRYTFEKRKINIAQYPANPRDSAKLLVYNRLTGKITDTYFYEIDKFLPKDSNLVVNNSQVKKCRYLFDEIEVFALSQINEQEIWAMVRPGKKFKLHNVIELIDGISCTVQEIDDDGFRRLKFSHNLDSLINYQHIPLPPYINQDDSLADEYQTVYSKELGSLASPTAGLHFTEELINRIKLRHQILELTLHVGLGTFAPLKEEHFNSNKLHSEEYFLDSLTAEKISCSDSLVVVGTTSARTLESIANQLKIMQKSQNYQNLHGTTDIFIQPGYQFQLTKHLITNFHLPGTSLLLLVEAFLGSADELDRIYNHAVDNDYRFYSFGDGMLIL